MISKIAIQAKIVSKFFSPTEYFESGTIGYRKANSYVGKFPSDPSKAMTTFQINLKK